MRHRRLAALLGVVALLAACTSSEAEPVPPIGGESPAPTPSPSPSPTPDPYATYAIPDEIDEAYVDLVANEIFSQISGLLADILRQPTGYSLDEEDAERLQAVAEGARLAQMLSDYQSFADTPRDEMEFYPPDDFGQVTWSTELILEANDQCIIAIGFYDNSQISTAAPTPDQYSIVSLAAHERGTWNEDLNPTPWRLRDLSQLVAADGEQIDREAWPTIDYSPLDNTCSGEEAQ